MNKEKQAFELIEKIQGNCYGVGYDCTVGDISIHPHKGEGTECFLKIYCAKGYCWEFRKEKLCDPDDVAVYSSARGYPPGEIDKNGYRYYFCEPWEGFKESGIDEAIKILKSYL